MLSALPWLIGGFFALAVFYKKSGGFHTCGAAIYFGVGGYIGYLLYAAISFLDDLLGGMLLTVGTLHCAATIAIATGLFAIYSRYKNYPQTPPAPPTRFSVVPALVVAPYLLFAILLMTTSVIDAWDTIDHWAPTAVKIIRHKNQSLFSPFDYEHYHPRTVSAILSWSLWACSKSSFGCPGSVGIATPWLAVWISTILLLYGWTMRVTRSAMCTSISLFVLLTAPLFENHVMRAGYAELMLGLSLTAGMTIIFLGRRLQSRILSVVGLVLLSTATFIKNTGPIYFGLAVLALAMPAFYHCRKQHKIIFALLSLLTLLMIYRSGIQISILGNSFGYDADFGFILMGGRTLYIDTFSISAALSNMTHAAIYNQSFSTLFMIAVVCLFSYLGNPKIMTHEGFEILTMLSFFTFVLLALILVQGTTYGADFSSTEGDTGLSRFAIPAFVMIPFLIAPTFRAHLDIGKPSGAA